MNLKAKKVLKVAVLIIIAFIVLKLVFGLINVLLATASSAMVVIFKLIPAILVIFLLSKIVKKAFNC